MNEKYNIRFFFDYGGFRDGSCLWMGDERTEEAFGTPIKPEKLPLSTATVEKIHELSDWFQDSLDWSNAWKGIIYSQEECDRFNAAAQQLFEDIKSELGESFELVNEQDVLTPGSGAYAYTQIADYHPFRSAKAQAEYLAQYDEQAKAWPVASETRMIDTFYGPTYVRISGSASAPPLVLLHGAGGNSLGWISYIKQLSGPYRTFAVDNICDYGRSISRRPVKNMAQMVDWLDSVLTALDLTRGINLIGESYGGALAGRYALRFPQRLRKAALLAPICTVQPISLAFYLRGLPAILPYRATNKRFLRWILEDLTRGNETLLNELVDSMMMAKRCFKPGHGVTRFSLLPPVMTDAELQALQQVPILFLLGEKEKIYSAQKAVQRLNRVAPQLQVAIVPQAGHDFIGTQVEQVNRRVLAFLQQP